MNILIINSDALYCKNDKFYIHKNTGAFLANLSKKGVHIHLFHFKISNNSHTVSNFEINENVNIHIAKRYSSKFLSYFFATIKLLRVINKVDLLYLFYPNAFFFSTYICLLMRKPFALYLRGEKKINSKLSRFFYRKARFVTSISPKFTDLVIKSGGRGFTIKPMIDFDIDDIKINKEKSVKNEYSILYIGRVERDKGMFELISAVNELKKRNIQNFKLHIIGNGEHFNNIKDKIIENRIEDRVTLYGTITNKSIIKEFYEKADLFILPSHHEGFPRVLYEAMIFDIPIVTTFVGTIPYLMQDNFNCCKIEVQSVESIVEKLSSILNYYPSTGIIAKNATKTIREYLQTYDLSHEEIIMNNLNEYKS